MVVNVRRGCPTLPALYALVLPLLAAGCGERVSSMTADRIRPWSIRTDHPRILLNRRIEAPDGRPLIEVLRERFQDRPAERQAGLAEHHPWYSKATSTIRRTGPAMARPSRYVLV